MFLLNWFYMIIGSKIFHKQVVQNSLDWAKENINNSPDGSIFMADNHKKTRGRLGRSWFFDKDQLVVTILLKPSVLNTIEKKDLGLRLNQLNMAITLGILEPLNQYGVSLKWPNDFYFNNKKLGGVLAKTIWSEDSVQAVIFAFSLNVNNQPPVLKESSYEAVSINQILGKKLNKEDLFNEILESIDNFYFDWLSCNYDIIFKKWRKAQGSLGKLVKVHKLNGELVEGKFWDITTDGNMLLKISDNCFEIPAFIVENIV